MAVTRKPRTQVIEQLAGERLKQEVERLKNRVSTLREDFKATWVSGGKTLGVYHKGLRDIKDWQDVAEGSFSEFKMPAGSVDTINALRKRPDVVSNIALAGYEWVEAQLQLAQLSVLYLEEMLAKKNAALAHRRTAGGVPLSAEQQAKQEVEIARVGHDISALKKIAEEKKAELRHFKAMLDQAVRERDRLLEETGVAEVQVRSKGDDWERLPERAVEKSASLDAQERQSLVDSFKNLKEFNQLPEEVRMRMIDQAIETGIPVPLRGKKQTLNAVVKAYGERFKLLSQLRLVWSSIYEIVKLYPAVLKRYPYLSMAKDNIQRLDHGYKMLVWNSKATFSQYDPASVLKAEYEGWNSILKALVAYFPGLPSVFPQLPRTAPPDLPPDESVKAEVVAAREKAAKKQAQAVTTQAEKKAAGKALRAEVPVIVQQLVAPSKSAESVARSKLASSLNELRGSAKSLWVMLRAKIEEGEKQLSELPTQAMVDDARAELERLSFDLGDAQHRLDFNEKTLQDMWRKASRERPFADPATIPGVRVALPRVDELRKYVDELKGRVTRLIKVVGSRLRVSSRVEWNKRDPLWRIYITRELMNAAANHERAVRSLIDGLAARKLIPPVYPAKVDGKVNIMAKGQFEQYEHDKSIDDTDPESVELMGRWVGMWTDYIKEIQRECTAVRAGKGDNSPLRRGDFQTDNTFVYDAQQSSGGTLDPDSVDPVTGRVRTGAEVVERKARRREQEVADRVWNEMVFRTELGARVKPRIKDQPEPSSPGDVVAVSPTLIPGGGVAPVAGSMRPVRYGKKVPLKRLIRSKTDPVTGEKDYHITAAGRTILSKEAQAAARRWYNMIEEELERVTKDPLPPAPAGSNSDEAALWYENERKERAAVVEAYRKELHSEEVVSRTVYRGANWIVVFPHWKPGVRLPEGNLAVLKKYRGALVPGGGWAGPFNRQTAVAILQSEHGRKRGRQKTVEIKKTASFNTAFDLIQQAIDAAAESGANIIMWRGKLVSLRRRYGGDRNRWLQLRSASARLNQSFRLLLSNSSDEGTQSLNIQSFRDSFKGESRNKEFCSALQTLLVALGSNATYRATGQAQEIRTVEDLVDTRVLTSDEDRPVGLASILSDVEKDWSSRRPESSEAFHLRDNLWWLVVLSRLALDVGAVFDDKFGQSLCAVLNDDAFYEEFYPAELVSDRLGGVKFKYAFRPGLPEGTQGASEEDIQQYARVKEFFDGKDFLRLAAVQIAKLARYYAELPAPVQHLYVTSTNFYAGITGNIPYLIDLRKLAQDPSNPGPALYVRGGLTAEQAGVDPVGLMRLFNQFNQNFMTVMYAGDYMLEVEHRLNLIEAFDAYKEYDSLLSEERQYMRAARLEGDEEAGGQAGRVVFWVRPYSDVELAKENRRRALYEEKRAKALRDWEEANKKRAEEYAAEGATTGGAEVLEVEPFIYPEFVPLKLQIKAVYPRASEVLSDRDWWKLGLPFTETAEDDTMPVIRRHLKELAREELDEEDDEDDDDYYFDGDVVEGGSSVGGTEPEMDDTTEEVVDDPFDLNFGMDDGEEA